MNDPDGIDLDGIEWDDEPTAVVVPIVTAEQRAAIAERRARRLSRLAERYQPTKETT